MIEGRPRESLVMYDPPIEVSISYITYEIPEEKFSSMNAFRCAYLILGTR